MAALRYLILAAGAALTACSGPPSRGALHASRLECVPYARAVSGIQLFGDAADWWDAAAGRYRRTARPESGAVLVFQRTARLPHGHVSVVASLRSPREIAVTQANWVHGRVAQDEAVVDVSAGNDWTAVRVWWQPAGQLGAAVYPTYGFVTQRRAAPRGETGLETSSAAPAAPAAGVVCPASDTQTG